MHAKLIGLAIVTLGTLALAGCATEPGTEGDPSAEPQVTEPAGDAGAADPGPTAIPEPEETDPVDVDPDTPVSSDDDAADEGSADAGSTPPADPTLPPCADLDGGAALATWFDEIPEPEGFDVGWDRDYTDTATYDACAALSWMVLPLDRGTASSPYEIVLFHQGVYVGTAADKPYGFHPEVERLADDAIEVTYTWPKDGEANAAASGRSVSTYTWAGQSVEHAGELPPY